MKFAQIIPGCDLKKLMWQLLASDEGASPQAAATGAMGKVLRLSMRFVKRGKCAQSSIHSWVWDAVHLVLRNRVLAELTLVNSLEVTRHAFSLHGVNDWRALFDSFR